MATDRSHSPTGESPDAAAGSALHLAAEVGHDFRNLLTVILGNAARLRRTAGLSADARELLAQIEAAAERGAEMAHELMRYGREAPAAVHQVRVAEVVERLLPVVRAAVGPAHPVEFACDAADDGRVLIDPAQLERVVLNLALNARDAMPDGGTIRVSVGPSAGGCVRVEVADTGHGIDPAVRDRIFDPYFTTKAARGTGLGLSMVKRTAERAGGSVRVDSEPGRGTRVRVDLPRAVDD